MTVPTPNSREGNIEETKDSVYVYEIVDELEALEHLAENGYDVESLEHIEYEMKGDKEERRHRTSRLERTRQDF